MGQRLPRNPYNALNIRWTGKPVTISASTVWTANTARSLASRKPYSWKPTKKGKRLPSRDDKGQVLPGNKCEVIFACGGYTGDPNNLKAGDTIALRAVADGKLNPQARESALVTERVINALGKGNIAACNFGGHSLAVSNAMASQTVCDLEGVPSKTMLLLESAGGLRGEAMELGRLKQALCTPAADDTYSQAFTNEALRIVKSQNPGMTDQAARQKLGEEVDRLQQDMDNKTINIFAVERGGKGLKGTVVSNLVTGQGWDAAYKKAMSDMLSSKFGGNPYGIDPRKNPGGMGTVYYEDLSGIASVSDKNTLLAQLDPNHQLSSLVNGANQHATLISAADAMKASGVSQTSESAYNSGTAPPGARSPSDGKSR